VDLGFTNAGSLDSAKEHREGNRERHRWIVRNALDNAAPAGWLQPAFCPLNLLPAATTPDWRSCRLIVIARQQAPAWAHLHCRACGFEPLSHLGSNKKGGRVKQLFLAVLASCLTAPAVFAQEHYTEGPVWECSSYRTKPGHFDDYLEYLRQNLLPQNQAAKQAGLMLDQKTYLHVPANPTEPDVLLCTLHRNFAKALDYDATDEAKGKEIASRHWKTSDEQKQRAMSANRLEFRDFLGTSYWREVNLKPVAAASR
jgi:hypothetical protein